MRALIVDDSSVMRKVVERALRQAGIEITDVVEASGGVEALAILRTADPFDLILSDVNMPGMDGLQLIERLRAEVLAPGIPVFMITANASEPLVLRAIAAGASGYILKPFTLTQIRITLLPPLLAFIAST